MTDRVPGIISTGYAVPDTIRTNDDPVFDWLKKNNPAGINLFTGYEERRVLCGEEDLMTIMLPAAERALRNAGMVASQVDLLLGTGSVSPYRNPNILSQLHRQLGLPASCWVIPLENEFSNYNAALLIADALIRAGRYETILICVGGNWSRNVDDHTPQAVSAGDGAGAAVVSAGAGKQHWRVVDHCTLTASQYYGTMYTAGDRYQFTPPLERFESLWSDPYFHISDAGLTGFHDFGLQASTAPVLNLLQKHGLAGEDIALISHQASAVLMDTWNKVIKPAEYVSTLPLFANMAPAAVPVTMAWAEENSRLSKTNLMLFSLGPDMHANAVLLQKSNATDA